MRILFTGIQSYIDILRPLRAAVFVSGKPFGPEFDAEFEAWQAENAQNLAKAREAEQRFAAESFALDTLCGAVLQVAEKAIELYAPAGAAVPTNLASAFTSAHLAKFCVGRLLRSVPLGAVVYAARNQHTHFNDGQLKKPSAAVFDLLASAHGYRAVVRDPAFDLDNPALTSYAGNVLGLMEWRSYDAYARDMRAMLTPQGD